MTCCSAWPSCLSSAECRSIFDPITGPSLRRRQCVSGCSVSAYGPSSSHRAVHGRTATLRASTDDYGMNCWIESCLIHCGRSRCWSNAGGKRIPGFGLTVPWAIVRRHRTPSRHGARESHCKWYNYRGQVTMACELRASRPVEVASIGGPDALVAVVFHQRFDVTALGFEKVMLDGQRADLVFVEGETFECRDLSAFNVHAHVMNEARSLRSIENVPECLSGELDGRVLVCLHLLFRDSKRIFRECKRINNATPITACPEFHPLARFTEDDCFDDLAGASLHASGKRINADPPPALFLERLGI